MSYNIDEIQRAIDKCPKHKVVIKPSPSIDGDIGGDIVTIEIKYLLHFLGDRRSNRETV